MHADAYMCVRRYGTCVHVHMHTYMTLCSFAMLFGIEFEAELRAFAAVGFAVSSVLIDGLGNTGLVFKA